MHVGHSIQTQYHMINNDKAYTVTETDEEKDLSVYQVHNQGPEVEYSVYRVFQKTAPLFYFCDNFRKWTPILTIYSPLEPDIYDA